MMDNFQYVKLLMSKLLFIKDSYGDDLLDISTTDNLIYNLRNSNDCYLKNYNLVYRNPEGIALLEVIYPSSPTSLCKKIDILKNFPYLREENQFKIINMLEL